MKILIDGTPLLKSLTGIGNYTFQLAKNLKKPGIDIIFYYIWFWSSKLRERPSTNYSIVVELVKKYIPRPYILTHSIKTIIFNLQIAIEKPDIIFEPNYICPPIFSDIPTVITVHDLSHIRFPEFHPEDRVKYFNKFLPQSLKDANKIVSVSEFTKRELIDLGLAPKEKIDVIYNGVSNAFRPYSESEVKKTLLNYHLNYKDFILSIGTLEPRKNLSILFKAYKKLLKRNNNIPKLIIAGGKGWNIDLFEDEMKTAINDQQVNFLGYIDNIELQHIYASAKFFVFPSLYEGFGLPPLEAMASGTPVISSNCSSLPEVIGEAGILVNPTKSDEFCKNMELLNEDSSLRADLTKKGLKQSKKFSWENGAKKLNDLFREVIEEKRN